MIFTVLNSCKSILHILSYHHITINMDSFIDACSSSFKTLRYEEFTFTFGNYTITLEGAYMDDTVSVHATHRYHVNTYTCASDALVNFLIDMLRQEFDCN